MDGSLEEKTFAPGYGEYESGTPDGDQEIAAFAVPTDARPGPIPPALTVLTNSIRSAFDVSVRDDLTAARAAYDELAKAWEVYRFDVPEVLSEQMDRDLTSLLTSVSAGTQMPARDAALRVAQNGLDLRLRYEPVLKVDLARLEMWGRQLLIDSADSNPGAVLGDAATLGWTMDRVRHTVDGSAAARLDAEIKGIREAAKRKDFRGASAGASRLLAILGSI
jgi:hypothetical protein